ncbi:RNA polymerase sigma factor [Streptomyces sp. NPDC020379]|uniref:RNA polymerase sigma factor n=1 Tax=Streptomyces sp. NPDC020379 TaxID=3365071 RepID=UPI0037A8BCAF
MTGETDRLPPLRTCSRRLAITFAAFREMHARRWCAYAHVHTGDGAAAEEIVTAVLGQLGRQWPHVLRRPSADAYAWSSLKGHLAAWLAVRGRDSALVTAAFGCVTRLPRECRQRFELLENRMALYAAITRLPERQCDALVLSHVIGYSVGQVASLLGTDESLVRSHIGHAKRKLGSGPPVGHPVSGS